MNRPMPRPIQATHSHAAKTAIVRHDDGRPLTHFERLQTQDVRQGLERRLGGRVSVDEFIAIVSGQLRSNPALLRCKPSTLFGAVYEAAQLGLRPDPTLQHCFLVPYKAECKLILGYRGMILLATQGSEAAVTKVEADIVYENDVFEDVRGMHRSLIHKRSRSRSRQERGEPVAVYAVAHLRDASPSCEVLDWWQVLEMKEAASSKSPWHTFVEEMAKKTAIRRVLKYAPLSPLAARGLDLDERAEAGIEQRFDVQPGELPSDDEAPQDERPVEAIDTEGVERIAGVDDVDV